jgi:hypothetical protein
MKRGKTTKSPEEQYFRALTLLDETTKYLKSAGCDRTLLHTVERLVKHLRDKTGADIQTILESTKSHPSTLANEESQQETDEQLASLSADQLRQKLTDPMLPRKYLERIAKIRFGVSAGALSMLRSKESLTNKLLTLTANEATHDSITKLASTHRQD